MRYLRTPGNPCAQVARRFAGLLYVPLLYVPRAQIPASGSVRHLVRGSLCVVRELLCISGGLKFAYRILGVVRGVLDGGRLYYFVFCWIEGVF